MVISYTPVFYIYMYIYELLEIVLSSVMSARTLHPLKVSIELENSVVY